MMGVLGSVKERRVFFKKKVQVECGIAVGMGFGISCGGINLVRKIAR